MNSILIGLSRLAIFLAILSTANCQAAEASAFQTQCKQFGKIDETYFATEEKNPDSFWSNPTIRKVYLVALHGNEQAAEQAVSQSDDRDAANAAVLLAGLVRHDAALIKTGFSQGALLYFNGRSIFTPLTMAASCDFDAGVTFLLRKKLDPNSGNDVGAFNAALANHNASVARQVLAAGYKIDSDNKRCRSSKQIVEKAPAATPSDVRTAVESSTCAAPTATAQ